ncbi:uncharacterized protein LOC130753974 isoform X6 [Actinidia eriantha]|uniref:uncharacterized protein LOC130753974 isoform X6 n=1 Tax=Actinidia eriantha TaxID=165200 RepID=UPI00258F5F0E|nr:uncharacterized protein LOC130753974 isoform X6 [Actinidia eriantha]
MQHEQRASNLRIVANPVTPKCRLLAFTLSLSLSLSLSHRPSVLSPPNSRVRVSKLSKTSLPLKRTTGLADSLSKSSKKKRKYTCFRKEYTSSEYLESKNVENELEAVRVDPEFGQSNIRTEDWVSSLRKAADAVFSSEPWTVPWTVKTILQQASERNP